MRPTGAFILIALILSVMASLSAPMPVLQDYGAPCLETLDVCHAADSPGSVNDDMPFFCESPMDIVCFETALSHQLHTPLPVLFVSSNPEEHPPKS